MTRIQPLGVSLAVTMNDVVAMGGDAQQDVFIAEVAKHLQTNLREFVRDAQPKSDLVFQVTGPHSDPLQGLIYVHTLSGQFDLDALPTESAAYRVHVEGEVNAAPPMGRLNQ